MPLPSQPSTIMIAGCLRNRARPSGNEFVFQSRLIDDLDEGAETAVRQSRKAVDDPVRAAFKPRPRRPGPRRFAAVQLAIAREVSLDALLEIGLDLVGGRTLLDRGERQSWLSIVLTGDAENIGGSLPGWPRGERPSLPYEPTRPTVPRLSQAVAVSRCLHTICVPSLRAPLHAA